MLTTKGLDRAGGIESLAEGPELAGLDVMKAGWVASIDDAKLLSFGLDTCVGVRALVNAIHRDP